MLNRYEIDKTINIFKNDKEFQDMLSECDAILDDDNYRQLAIVLLENKEEINNKTIDELNASAPPIARDDIASICGKSYIEGYMYRQVIYTFKYSTIKIFFRQNYSKFMPDYDFTVINSQPKMKLFIEAFMRVYDRFANIVDEIYNLVDVDKTPEKYLNYLAQAIGYEREDNNLLNNVSFRELIKNIVEVYKIKGTNYSFELFFNFLGFQAELKEYWFDKRFGDPNISSNPETGTSNKNNFSFYLTTKKPTSYIPLGMKNSYIISDDQIISTLDINEFNRKISSGEFTVKQLLGDETGYSNQPYTFFKTNVMEYNLENTRAEEGSGELSSAALASIERYANFLTPIFMQKNIVVSIKPFEDFAGVIMLTDADRTDPRSGRQLSENMIHTYEGYQPAYYYWEDGVRYYNESALRSEKFWPRADISNPEGGGHFISNFYIDTTEKINQIREDIENEFPFYSDAEVSEVLSQRISNKSIFGNTFPNRDLLYPYVDKEIVFPFRSMLYRDSFEPGSHLEYNYNFSNMKGEKKRLSEAYNEVLDNKTKIQSIVLDNGSGNSVVKIDKISTYRHISQGDEIKILFSRDINNNGVYEVLDSTDTGSYIEIELDGQVNSKQRKSGGFIQIYYNDWKEQEFNFPFMFDRLINVEQERSPWYLDESYQYIDSEFNKNVDDDRTVAQSQMPPLVDLYNYSKTIIDDPDRISKLITYSEAAGQELKIAGLYYINHEATQYIRSSYKFENENPDFYQDFLDIDFDNKNFIIWYLDESYQYIDSGLNENVIIWYLDESYQYIDSELNENVIISPWYLDESYQYIDSEFNKNVDDDRTVTQSQMPPLVDLYNYSKTIIDDPDRMSELITYSEAADQELKVAGLYYINHETTQYIRSSYKFENENPDFYQDFLDIAKT